MSEVSQLFFQHKELVELLIKKANIHEGRWMLAVNFGFSAGNFGSTAEQVVPGAIVAVLGVGLLRAAQDTPDALQVDASVVNPAVPKPSRKKRAPK
jgi:hypothetical protein